MQLLSQLLSQVRSNIRQLLTKDDASKDKPTLLTLPREIRLEIYAHVYVPHTLSRLCGHKRQNVALVLPPRLGAVCKQLRNESERYYTAALRNESLTNFFNLSTPLSQRMLDLTGFTQRELRREGPSECWNVAIETPCNELYEQVHLAAAIGWNRQQIVSYCVLLSVVSRHNHKSKELAIFMGGNDQLRALRDFDPEVVARMMAEAILRTMGSVNADAHVASAKRRVMRRMLICVCRCEEEAKASRLIAEFGGKGWCL